MHCGLITAWERTTGENIKDKSSRHGRQDVTEWVEFFTSEKNRRAGSDKSMGRSLWLARNITINCCLGTSSSQVDCSLHRCASMTWHVIQVCCRLYKKLQAVKTAVSEWARCHIQRFCFQECWCQCLCVIHLVHLPFMHAEDPGELDFDHLLSKMFPI